MSTKEELHNLVDQLGDEQVPEVLAYLRRLLYEEEAPERTSTAELTQRMGPGAVSGHAFFGQPQTDLQTLAAQQGVHPVTNFDDLLGDFWPKEETADEFIAAMRQWRREGGYA